MNRHEFVMIFDARDANPNGDPDAGNLPRIDPETGHGLVTDVCLKRKVRNYVSLTRSNDEGHRIYFRERAVLNRIHEEAYKHIGEKPKSKKLPSDVEKARKLTQFMCQNFWDIRAFGAVMSTEVNCGQVRGPVQISFARSVDPIFAQEHAITRNSVTNERDLEKERTMGRKFTIPYGIYVAHGFINPFLADQTGFGDSDLDLLWESLANAFQFDQSAARPAGSMAMRRLVVFRHASKLGEAPSHQLFEALKVVRKSECAVPRKFADYEIDIDTEKIPAGVETLEKA
ncbi:MAG: type I-C CRISPR-associated protein Cas7/Csd2 [Planctomycetota bacterium]